MLGITNFRLSSILSWILELFQPSVVGFFVVVFHVVCPNIVAISWRSALIRDVVIISSCDFSSQVWYLISLNVIHVILLTAAPKSDDNNTTVYTGIGTFVAIAVVAVIIVLVTLR